MVTIQSSPTMTPRFTARTAQAQGPAVRFQGSTSSTQYIDPTALRDLDDALRTGVKEQTDTWLKNDGAKLRILDSRQWRELEPIWSRLESSSVSCDVAAKVLKFMPQGYRRQKLKAAMELGNYEPAATVKSSNYVKELESEITDLRTTLVDYREEAQVSQQDIEKLESNLEFLDEEKAVTAQQDVINSLQFRLDQLNGRIQDMTFQLDREEVRPPQLDKEIVMKTGMERGNMDLLAHIGISPSTLDKPRGWVQTVSKQRAATLRELGPVLKSMVSRGEKAPKALPPAPTSQQESPILQEEDIEDILNQNAPPAFLDEGQRALETQEDAERRTQEAEDFFKN